MTVSSTRDQDLENLKSALIEATDAILRGSGAGKRGRDDEKLKAALLEATDAILRENGPRRRGQHHGELREAMIEAADVILREKGIGGFTLRDAARQAGVSPGASAHHFGNVAGLLTEVALLAYAEMGRYLEEVDATGSPEARLRRLSAAYVRFALDHPARFQLMFRKELVNRDERFEMLSEQALLPFGNAAAALTGHKDLQDMKAKGAWGSLISAWSTAHGIACLAMENKFETVVPGNDRQVFLDSLLPEILMASWPEPGVLSCGE